MAVEAAVIQFRKSTVDAFQEKASIFRSATTKEAVTNGNQVTFLVSGSATDTAVTRGVNGKIPYGNPTNAQVTVTLAEKHAPYELTGFNVFSSQGDQTKIMRDHSIAVINREIDLENLSELANATVDTGASTQGSVALVAKSVAILGNAAVPVEEVENMFGVISPAFYAYLVQTKEFASSEYVDVKTFAGKNRKMLRWMGINWMQSSLISGLGTATELCYIWHRSALGYACNLGEDKIEADYDKKQDLSWSRATIYHKAKILQNSGIVQVKHDGSAYVGA